MPTTSATTATVNVANVVNIELSPFEDEQMQTLRRQLGRLTTDLVTPASEPAVRPDISIQFSAGQPVGEIRFAGVSDAGRVGDEFVLFSGAHAVRYELSDPSHIRICVPEGCKTIPLLLPLISSVAARKGFFPVHGSAFVWEGRGILVSGWSKGGKTETLLPFVLQGADYVGDEWLFLSEAGTVTAIPEPIRVWDRQIAELTALRSVTPARDRLRMSMWRLAASATGAFGSSARARQALDRQRWVRLDPTDLFGAASCRRSAEVHSIVIVGSSTDGRTTLSRIPATTAGSAVAATTRFEHLRILEMELKRQYLFPPLQASLWSDVDHRLSTPPAALHALEAILVLHPHPVSSLDMFDTLSAALGSSE